VRVIEYRCADGTPFPVTFEDEAQAAKTWWLDREHTREPGPPLAVALRRLGGAGSERAYAEVGLVAPGPFRPGGPSTHGFGYFDTTPMTAEELGVMMAGCAKLIEVHGSAQAVWHDYCLPRAKESCAFLEVAVPGGATLQELAERQNYGQQMTMVPAFICGNDLMLLAATCGEIVGPDRAQLVAYELTQGYDNETLLADQALWDVAHDPTPQRVDAFLAEFGHRSEAWDIAAPTWNERREGFYRQLEAMAIPGTPEPRAAVEAGMRRRIALLEELDAELADDHAKRDRFHRRVERVATYVAVREERARWQLALVGNLRHAVLRIGAALVDRGVIDDREDVLYLLPDEIEGGGSDDLKAAVTERRAEHEMWKRVTPPDAIGADHPTAPPVIALPPDRTITGVGASRGQAVGTARVITDLADADSLEPGDVLVCVSTSPPWTPLFGLAAAIVVDSGDMGSHSAIAAREYGIPCVLATAIGTAAIADGATVKVDGDAGTVEVFAS
jgi:phosphohistidine swiveling domain-containing protein